MECLAWEKIGGSFLYKKTILLIFTLVIFSFLTTSCPSPKKGCDSQAKAFDPEEQVSITPQKVTYCWEKPDKPKNTKVQILVDGSGSMVGFKDTVPGLVDWVRQAISTLQGSTINSESSRSAIFTEKVGIKTISDINQALNEYSTRGNTNLHEAINSAKDYGLTFIITDGVAAATGKGTGDCAAGVDASCVARALKEVVLSEFAKENDNDPGIWMIPLMSNYNGIFYTEESVKNSAFSREDILKNVETDVGTQAIAQNSKEVGGKLVYDYRGPRSLVLIIISRWSNVGRAATEALWNRSSENSIQQSENLKGFGAKTTALTPIEVYPGFLNSFEWDKLEQSDLPSDYKGTIDAKLAKGTKQASEKATPSLQIQCPINQSGCAVYTLKGKTLRDQNKAGCVNLIIVPPFKIQIRASSPDDNEDLKKFFKDVKLTDDYTQQKLTLTCLGKPLRTCSDSPIKLQWVALAQYREAADAIVSGTASSSNYEFITSISTKTPSLEPHKIFGFASTLEKFYLDVSNNERKFVLTSLNVCSDVAPENK